MAITQKGLAMLLREGMIGRLNPREEPPESWVQIPSDVQALTAERAEHLAQAADLTQRIIDELERT